MDLLLAFIEAYLRAVIPTVLDVVGRGGGADVIGRVRGRRITEDVQIEMDKICTDLFVQTLQPFEQQGLRIRFFSEHDPLGAGSQDPTHLCAIDPFDGSGLLRRGLQKEWYTVLTIFDLNGMPLAGGAVDILARQLYLANNDGVFQLSLLDNSRAQGFPSQKTALDNNTVLAAYLMNRIYRVEWQEKAEILSEKMPGGILWCNGGSCIYHLIAAGQVHAYVMFREPKSEIDPGLAFAHFAPFPVFSVEGDRLTPYRFVPGRQAERVPFFVAACTEELAREIVQTISGS